MLNNRCEECGSWEAECAADEPVWDCGCARCAGERVRKQDEELKALRARIGKMALAILGYIESVEASCADSEDEHAECLVHALPKLARLLR